MRCLLAALLLLAFAAPVEGATVVELISRDGATPADGDSTDVHVGPDGRWVAFATTALNLGAQARGAGGLPRDAVVLHDRRSGRTRLVSPPGEGGDAYESDQPSVSAGGRFVAFLSDGPLVPDDRDGRPQLGPHTEWLDVYVRDLRRGTLTLVSRRGGRRGASGEGLAWQPSISADGRRVAFESQDPLLAPRGGPRQRVYVRDLRTARLTALPLGRGRGRALATDDVELAAGGRFVSYTVARGPADRPRRTVDVLRHDLRTGRTVLVDRSRMTSGSLSAYANPTAISRDGRRVAFVDFARGGTPRVWVWDARTGRARLVARRAALPRMSADGSTLAYARIRDAGATYVHRLGRRPRRVPGETPALTPDGRLVAYMPYPAPDIRHIVLARP